MVSQPTAENSREDNSLTIIDSKTDSPGAYHPPSITGGGNDDYYPSSFAKKKKTKSNKTKSNKSKNKDQYRKLSRNDDDSDNDDDDDTDDDGLDKNLSSTISSPPSKLRVHAALFTVQVIFGISAVVGRIGLPRFHPLTFALYRESSAAILLSIAGHVASVRAGRAGGLLSGSWGDARIILMCGCGIFASQACYIVGIKLSGAIAASVWQPSQPILTAAMCMLLQWEPYNSLRVFGILIAFFSCAVMVLGGGDGESDGEYGPSNESSGFPYLIGQVSFFINCLGSSVYVLASKLVLNTGRYESLAITAWGYIIAASLMAISSSSLSLSSGVTNFLCSDCGDNIWHVPMSAVPAMVWFVIMTSSSAYALLTWANKHATGTLVIGYSVMQPVASAILIQALISFGLYKGCGGDDDGDGSVILEGGLETEDVGVCLDEPDRYTIFGALGVFVGLFVVIWTEPSEGGGDISGSANDAEAKALLLEMTDVSGKGDFDDEDEYGYGDDDDDLESLEGQD